MKKINSFAITHLHIASLVDFHNAARIAFGTPNFTNAAWKALRAEHTEATKTLEDVVRRQRESIWTADVRAADALRDSSMRQFFLAVDSAARSTVAEERETARRLQVVVRPYRRDTYDQYTDQTEQIRGMLRILADDEPYKWVTQLALAPILARLDDQNAAFDKIYTKRAVEREGWPAVGIETRAQSRLANALYRQLVTMANDVSGASAAGIETGFDAAKLDTMIDTVNGLVAQYRLVVANQNKTWTASGEEPVEVVAVCEEV